MKPDALVREYLLGDAQTMQLATVANGKPWVASVYFVADNELNVYWLSWPERRHSREIAANVNVAATVAIKSDSPVIGVQLEGEAYEIIDSAIVADVMKRYITKYDAGKEFVTNFQKGINHHKLYKLVPSTIQLFDEVNFLHQSPLQMAL